jgi:hypothetical protein
MLIEKAVELAVPSELALQELVEVSGGDLARIAGAATSSGEALLESTGLRRLDVACHCHFGAQLGRPAVRGPATVMELRWWNDKSRSLTPGFIGELELRTLPDELTELAIVGQYHPRAHLYELVDNSFLRLMAKAVVSSFLDQLRDRVLKALPARPAEAVTLS